MDKPLHGVEDHLSNGLQWRLPAVPDNEVIVEWVLVPEFPVLIFCSPQIECLQFSGSNVVND
jgi:hypothetical protein